jgi:hypothetical protein
VTSPARRRAAIALVVLLPLAGCASASGARSTPAAERRGALPKPKGFPLVQHPFQFRLER